MLLQDLAVILLISGFTAYVFHRLNQPTVIGYVLAGLIIGPHTPPFSFIHDEEVIRTLGDIGLVFLMFSLGLDFNLRRLRRVGATALVTAGLDVVVMVWLGYLLGRAMGWSPLQSLFLGAIVCDSSTTILAKILQEMGRTNERFAGVLIGITIVEDLLAVAMIAILSGLAMTGTVQPDLVASRLWKLVLFLVLVTVVGLLSVPRLLNHIQKYRNEELLIVGLVGLCFGVALLAVRLELSLALGAVLIGAIASESRALPRIAVLVGPLRHVFSAVFFVTIGLRFDPVALQAHIPVLVAVVVLVVAGKFLTNTAGTLLTGNGLDTSVRVGAGMAQVGEFAFIISALALSLGVGGDAIYPVGVGVAVLTTVLSPYLIRGADRGLARFEGSSRGRRWSAGVRLYGEWVGQIGQGTRTSAVRRIVRRSLAMILVNLALIAAIFGLGGYVEDVTGTWGAHLFRRPGLYAALVWMSTALLALPLYVVTARKVDALGMILAEAALPATLTGGWVRPVRTILSTTITLAGGVGLVVLTFLLSSTMLPSVEVFLLLLALTLGISLWARHRMASVYRKAHSALQDILSGTQHAGSAASVPDLSTSMDCVLLEASSAPTGTRTLHSLDLRRRTGATIVAFERTGQRISNPDPEKELLPGDRLFLLGAPDQIRAAAELLNPRQPAGDGGP